MCVCVCVCVCVCSELVATVSLVNVYHTDTKKKKKIFFFVMNTFRICSLSKLTWFLITLIWHYF